MPVSSEITGAEFWERFVLAVLATWRVTHLLASEDGPADLIVRLRVRLGARLLGKLMDCFQCLSLWVAAPLAFFVAQSALHRVIAWLALSGAACLLERAGSEPVGSEPVVIRSLPPEHQLEEGEGNDGMLRSEKESAQQLSSPGYSGDSRSNSGETARSR